MIALAVGFGFRWKDGGDDFLGAHDPDAIGDALEDATHYEPTPAAQFHAMLDALGIAPQDSTFVDVGAGMGRIVLPASLRPFKQIAGVEV